MAVRYPHGVLLKDPTKSPKPEVLQVKSQGLNGYKLIVRCMMNVLKE